MAKQPLIDINDFTPEQREFWGLVTDEDIEQAQATLSRRKLRAYAEEHELLVRNGELIRPENYPCKCELQSPQQCAEERNSKRDYCSCPCHRYFAGF